MANKKDTKKTPSLEFENFRILRLDDMNWIVETRTKKGGWATQSRKYYSSVRVMAEAILEKKVTIKKETKSIKKLIKNVDKAKEEVKEVLKALKKAGIV